MEFKFYWNAGYVHINNCWFFGYSMKVELLNKM
jgi:hypothetical protein